MQVTNAHNQEDVDKAQQALYTAVEEFKHSKFGKENVLPESHHHDQQVIDDTLCTVGADMTDRLNTAILTYDISYRNTANVRRDISMEHKDQKKQYVVKPDRFQFDRSAARQYIASQQSKDNNINWLEMSRIFPVLQQDGRPASNGNIVLKQFAIDESLIAPTESVRQRRCKRKIEMRGLKIDLSKIFPTDQALKDVTRQKIAAGVWSVGTPICPITLQYKRVENGQIATRDLTIYGRTFSLQYVMDRTLRWHEERGLLRPPFTDDYDVKQALSELEQKGQSIYLFKIKIISFLQLYCLFGCNNGCYDKILASCHKNRVKNLK